LNAARWLQQPRTVFSFRFYSECKSYARGYALSLPRQSEKTRVKSYVAPTIEIVSKRATRSSGD
jgi:hypothetical protein